MADEALNKIAEYVSKQPAGGHPEWIRAELRPMIQEVLDEVASEIAANWGYTDARAQGLAFALGYLHGRYKVKKVVDPGPASPYSEETLSTTVCVDPRCPSGHAHYGPCPGPHREDEAPCSYTQSHTREFCGNPGCRA